MPVRRLVKTDSLSGERMLASLKRQSSGRRLAVASIGIRLLAETIFVSLYRFNSLARRQVDTQLVTGMSEHLQVIFPLVCCYDPRNHSRVSSAAESNSSHAVKEAAIDTHSKALKINLDPRLYGTFAEIGAGQEVVRWFFRVGGAAGTVAKSMSAYDMQVSDAIYGHADRYVSRGRLQAMLDREFDLDVERLGQQRGDDTSFFAFADTVVARTFAARPSATAGWASSFRAAPTISPARP